MKYSDRLVSIRRIVRQLAQVPMKDKGKMLVGRLSSQVQWLTDESVRTRGRPCTLTPEQCEDVVERLDQGVSLQVIARELGVHTATLYRCVLRMTGKNPSELQRERRKRLRNTELEQKGE